MNKSITIPKDPPQGNPLSYEFLYEEGMKLIRQLAGTTWTDHNVHDPGITILEQLCYALTDLAYRVDHDIRDLLGTDTGSSYQDLLGPTEVLTCNPVTLPDLRKIVIDVAGVKNAWVEKVVPEADRDGEENAGTVPKGLYRVAIEKDDLSGIDGTTILKNVKSRLHANREVSEDFEEVRLLDAQYIRLLGAIEVADKVEDINELVAEISYRTSVYLSPRISFYTLPQLWQKGKRTEAIFDGPLLTHGFIDDEELQQHTRRKEVHASDLIREIMDVKGVVAVDELSIATGNHTIKKWVLPLDPAKCPKLDVRNINAFLSTLTFTSHGVGLTVDAEIVESIFLKKLRASVTRKELLPEERDILLTETRDKQLSNYYSIQNQFPGTYGIGDASLPVSAPEHRKAQAKQLTAYLAHFEQLLANYFAQVAHFKKLVSFDGDDTRSYFYQSLLPSIHGFKDVLRSEENYQNYLAKESADTEEGLSGKEEELRQKNKFLNHLLSRFGEKLVNNGLPAPETSNSATTVETDPIKKAAKRRIARTKQQIAEKAAFLSDYPQISGGRAKAYNYSQEYWNNENVSGLERRIARKLGIVDISRRDLAEGSTEGFHMIEHLLLRPHKNESYPFEHYYLPGDISLFEEVAGEDRVRCHSEGHTLQSGESIIITNDGEGYYSGYQVEKVEDTSFEIAAAFQQLPLTATWQRRGFEIRHLVLFNQVSLMKAPSDDEEKVIVVEDDHDLEVGDNIVLIGSEHYSGTHKVLARTEGGFIIDKSWSTVDEMFTGWWKPAITHDDYSLQLTFVIPDWIGRFTDTSFREQVANTIREETPAHLKVYIKWMHEYDMKAFEQAFKKFLSLLKKR
ncbi:MAG: hypothetical protein AAGA66_05295 [Bacteroidota bacterium]